MGPFADSITNDVLTVDVFAAAIDVSSLFIHLTSSFFILSHRVDYSTDASQNFHLRGASLDTLLELEFVKDLGGAYVSDTHNQIKQVHRMLLAVLSSRVTVFEQLPLSFMES